MFRSLLFLLFINILLSAQASDSNQKIISARELADEISGLFESSANKVRPSVITIFSVQQKPVSSENGGTFERFFRGGDNSEKELVRGLASGIIVTEDGYILTNYHVIADAETIMVTIEGRNYEAKLVGTDPLTDLAVIKIDGENLPAAELGDSDELTVGQWVIAVGNPFELLQTVTAGIVSAKGRSLMGLADYEDFIQTDASMNPGNSGGALANLDGQIIGINTAISSPTGGNVGIGFAIPINMAREIMEQLIEHGKVSRGYLAIIVQDISENQASKIGLDTTLGAYVSSVEPDGPAARAGIQPGDVIIEFNDIQVENTTDLRTKIAGTLPGKTVKLTIIRNGKKMKMDVELSERPAQPQKS